MGMFRWCTAEGPPAMFEILTITAEGDELLLRLRHYTPTLVAKEDKDAAQELSATRVEAKRAVFSAKANCGTLATVTYERRETGRLAIEVAFAPESKRPPLKFDLLKE